MRRLNAVLIVMLLVAGPAISMQHTAAPAYGLLAKSTPSDAWRTPRPWLSPTPRPSATPRPPTATRTATSTRAPTSTPTPRPTPSATPTARSATPTPTLMPTTRIKIAGTSPGYVARIQVGLALMAEVAPESYAIISRYIDEIKEGPESYSWGGLHVIQITNGATQAGADWTGGIVLHEATHVRNWFEGDFPVYGCEGEAKSLRAQAAYLRLAGNPGAASNIEELIGTHC